MRTIFESLSPTPRTTAVALALGAVLAFAPVCALSAAPAATLTAEPNTIYLGESFSVALRVTGLDNGATPTASLDLSGPADLSGPSISRQSFTSVVNGRVTSENNLLLTYAVTPQDAGDFRVNGAAVRANGRDIPCRGTAVVRVIGPEASPYVSLSLSASRERVLVDEPFEVYADIIVRKLPEPFRNESPLLFSPAFTVPHILSAPSEDVEPQDLEALLRSLVARNGERGVSLSGIALQNGGFPFGGGFPFDPFESPRAAVFALPREDAELGGEPAWRYRLAVRFTPRAEGAIAFRPVVLRGDIVTGVRDGNRPVRTALFCQSDPLTVQVVPPPAEGRPSTFCGTVGTSLEATASLDAQHCRQGDPVRLTLDLSGDFSHRAFRTPALAARPGFDGVFRVYDDVKTESGLAPASLRLTYTLRPLRAGTIELPPIDIAYYNTASNAYAVARTAPVPLRVDEVPAFDPEAFFASLESDTADHVAESDTASEDLPPAILADPAALAVSPRESLAPPLLLAFAFALPLLTAVFALGRMLRRRGGVLRAAALRRRAPHRAARLLRRARDPGAALDAVRRFYQEAHGIPAAAFTPSDAIDASPAECRAELAALVQPLYDCSFHSSEDNPTLLSDARECLPDLLRRTLPADASSPRLPARLAHASLQLVCSVLLLAAIVALYLGIGAAVPVRESRIANFKSQITGESASSSDRFLWEQAGSLMAKASESADFLSAAHVYRRLLDARRDRPGVWRNYGAALLLAERPAEAYDAFRRAEDLAGTDPDLRHGLRAALRRMADPGSAESLSPGVAQVADLPWYRPVLAWHYALPQRARCAGAVAAWCVFWLAIWLRKVSRRAGMALAILAVVAFALLATSALAGIHVVGLPLPPIP